MRFERFGDVLTGMRLHANLQDERGFITDSQFELRPDAPKTPRARPLSAYQALPVTPATFGRGTADRIDFESSTRMRMQDASFTTCECGNETWLLRASELDLDQDRNVGVARSATLEFYGVPIAYTPYLSFPLKEERKTGFLTPTIGTSTKSGVQIALPFYWNIAPNYDATFTPRYFERRGAMLSSEGRWRTTRGDGTAFYEALPNDNASNGRYRYFGLLRAKDYLGSWYGAVNIQQVSDAKYFTDLSTNVAATSQAVLPREGTLGRSGIFLEDGVWSLSALYQKWQTLQVDPLRPVTPPYNRAPQITLTATKPDLYGFDLDLASNYNEFQNPLGSLPDGKRVMAYPSIAFPLVRSFGYLIPKVGVNYRNYTIDNKALAPDGTFTVTTPIFSVDSGLIFERDLNLFGRGYAQTIEPRVYYTNIPYRDQSRIPNFESAVQDISFSTLFTENQFSGYDRINDLHAVTAGVASRFIDTESGVERIRAAIAQRYYIEQQRVTLPGLAPVTSNSSDILAALSGLIIPGWTLDSGIAYSAQQSQTQRVFTALRYNPAPGKLLNAAYRFVRQDQVTGATNVDQFDISGQWPITPRWAVVGRYNYSTNDHRLLEGLGGIEYNDGCWAIRGVAHRFATTTTTETTSFFVQFELSGLSKVGDTAELLLRRSVPGYAAQVPHAPGAVDPYSNYR